MGLKQQVEKLESKIKDSFTTAGKCLCPPPDCYAGRSYYGRAAAAADDFTPPRCKRCGGQKRGYKLIKPESVAA